MFLIRIIPISRGIAKEELSYFSREKLVPGTFVSVPVRKREMPGLVVSSSLVRDVKSEVRTADFTLRKLTSTKNVQVVSDAFARAALTTADFHACSTGAVLYQTIPQAILTLSASKKDKNKSKSIESGVKPRGVTHEVRVLQAIVSERYKEYKNTVRETFARNGSTLLVVPTTSEAEQLYAELSKGIESYTFLLTGALTKKALAERWKKSLEEQHVVLIIATPGCVSIPRHDLVTIIIEREQSSLYRLIGRPNLDVRVLLDHLARELSVRLVRGDLPISIETAYQLRRGTYVLHTKSPSRITFENRTALIDMRTKHGAAQLKTFRIFSDELIDTTRDVLTNGGSVFLFATRRGLAPTTVCQDCGASVSCQDCGASVSLHAARGHNVFLCHSCGASRDAHECCTSCKSWRLIALGVGIERVLEETQKIFPDTPLFRIDRDTAQTKTKAESIAQSFQATPGSILIGTEMALSYLTSPVDFTAVVSIDSLFSLPVWNMYEKVFSLLMRLRERTTKLLLVQTRRMQARVLEHALTADVSSFFAEELADRKEFYYPPFSILIKITAGGSSRPEVEKNIALAQSVLQEFGFVTLPHLARTPKGLYAIRGFIRTPHDTWPNPELLAALRSLPPSLEVEINPESIL